MGGLGTGGHRRGDGHEMSGEGGESGGVELRSSGRGMLVVKKDEVSGSPFYSSFYSLHTCLSLLFMFVNPCISGVAASTTDYFIMIPIDCHISAY